MFMLRMQFEQRRADFAQLGDRRRSTIDLRTALARDVNHAPQNDGIGIRFGLCGEPGACRGIAGQVKLGRDVGLLLTNPNSTTVSPGAQRKSQSIEHDGFAGTCFAGKCGHA